MDRFQRSMANIPGLIEDTSDDFSNKNRSTRNLLEEEVSTSGKGKTSRYKGNFSSEFFSHEQLESDAELLKNVGSGEPKSFLIRPKSSGAKLYGGKSGTDRC